MLLRSLSDGRIDPDQAWLWTPEWLAGELEADREARSGAGEVYEEASGCERLGSDDPLPAVR